MWHTLAITSKTITNSLGSVLSAIVTQAGAIAQHLYLILVRQEIIIGVQLVITGSLWIIFAIVLWRCMKYVSKKRGWAKLDKELAIGVLGIVLFVSLITGVGILLQALPRIVNPEYYAIQDGIRLLREVKR